MNVKSSQSKMQFCQVLLALLFSQFGTLYGQAPSLDDFLAAVPVDDFQAPIADDPEKGIKAPTEVMAPGKVEVSEEIVTQDNEPTIVVEAAHTQDAINVAVKQMRKLDKMITKIKVGSGEGVVAKGSSIYQSFPNRNASLISKRLAYVKAHMLAKKNLAEHLNGLTNEGESSLADSVNSYDSENDSLANTNSITSETINQKIECLLRGSAIYDLYDNEENMEVEVFIVSTPKTRGETMEVSGGVIQSQSAREGLAKVFNELKSGVLPPTGGKVISTDTKEGKQLYFLSFGSEIIRSNQNPQVARKLKMNAAQVAQMRAANSMCALIIGEQASWSGGFSEKTQESQEQFKNVSTEDPTSEESSINLEPLDEIRSSFVNTMKTYDEYAYFSKGKLPPGLNVTRWVTGDGDWSYAAYIYNPNITLDATKLRDKMNQNSILQRGNSLLKQKSASSNSSKGKENSQSLTPKEVGKGPSGRVSRDEDL